MTTAFVHHAETAPAQAMALYLLGQGMRVTVSFTAEEQSAEFASALDPMQRDRCHIVLAPSCQMKAIELLLAEAATTMQGLELYVHANEWRDEKELLLDDPGQFIAESRHRLRELFLYCRAAGSVMARQRKGQIIVPMLSDALGYNGYPSAPVYNEGALAFVKSLAKELSPFRVSVNGLTFGYYRGDEPTGAAREGRRRFDLYALKPPVPSLPELAKGVGALVDYGYGMSGHNMTWGFGIPSTL